ncbi:aminopeptidase P family protein [uncultured Parasutterella sp.]|uniref:aminopeptidase P family protein n=1 Tax=uncultured Parasutterella sp. TaxID=1263098 RepID=UPI0025FDFE8E|nr:aminopeptidase P family protein [uncultured Parasutterella sp.]
MNSPVSSRLSALRIFLKDHGLNGWIVLTSDPHLSEYVDEHYAFRKWLSGFTGSAGSLLVTQDAAALITDSRYWVQAEQQLEDSGIELVKLSQGYATESADWFAAHLKDNDCVGINSELISGKDAKNYARAFTEKHLHLSLVRQSPEETVWQGRPVRAEKPIFDHTISPRSRKQKLAALQEVLKKEGADYLLTSKLDNIAWIFNLRGSDVADNPVFYAYALISSQETATLFINEEKVPDDLKDLLLQEGVALAPYHLIDETLASLSSGTVLTDPEEINASLLSHLPEQITRLELPNPIERMKALKTLEEIELISEAMLKDGIALVQFFAWLDRNLGKKEMTEQSLADKLLSFRQSLPGYISLSFETISAFGPNAALPHYQPEKTGGAKIEGNGFLLIDSGAQFPEGTTDITRTKLIGRATELMKEDYTAVLRANIRLALAVFPDGISSQILDPIAREPIWQHFANFGHGTGHGVGFFLNVHEGPQRISYPRISPRTDAIILKETAMSEGMVTSDEPGIYRPGRWGIRIENLVTSEFAETNEFGRFLKFKTLTLCPIDLSAVIPERLQPDEKKWLNEYHALVRQKVLPHIHDERTIVWLVWNTREI